MNLICKFPKTKFHSHIYMIHTDEILNIRRNFLLVNKILEKSLKQMGWEYLKGV